MTISIFNSKTFKDLSLSFEVEEVEKVMGLIQDTRVVKLFHDNTELMLYNLYMTTKKIEVIYLDNNKKDVNKRIYRIHFYDKVNRQEVLIDFKWLDRIFFQNTDIITK